MCVFSRLHKLLQMANKTKLILYLESAFWKGSACVLFLVGSAFFKVFLTRVFLRIDLIANNTAPIEGCLVIVSV